MRTGTLAALAAAAIGVGVAAWLVAGLDRGGAKAAEGAGQPLFPSLQAPGTAVGSVAVRAGASTFTVTQKDGVWALAEKGGYPANEETVRGVVRGLAGLRIVEPKTSRPEMYAKIGVQDPGDAPAAPEGGEGGEGAGPVGVTVTDAAGKELAAAIIGTQRFGPPAQVFVRRAGETQSWLAEGQVEAPREAMGWIERQVLNIPRDRVRSVVLTHPDGESVIASRASAAEKTLTVSGVPDGRELTSAGAADQLASWLSYVTVDDVSPTDRADLTEPGGAEPGATAAFTMFDGLVVVAEQVTAAGQTWIRFEASVDESVRPAAPAPAEGEQPPPADPAIKPIEEVRKEAEDLNRRFAGWAYQVPEHKAATLRTRMEGLLKPVTPAPAADQPPSAAPEPAAPPPR